MARTDTAGFYYLDDFYGHYKKPKPPVIPIPDDPVAPVDPCDKCPEGYTCENGTCIPKPDGGGGGGSGVLPPIDTTPPWDDEDTAVVVTEKQGVEAEECKATQLHNNGYIELQNGYITGADENSGARFFFNVSCYEEITFYGRLNAYYSTPRSILGFGWAGSNSTQTDAEIGLHHYVLNEGDRFRVTFRPSGDFRIQVQRVIDSQTMYDWETVEAGHVNDKGWWNPLGTKIVDLPAKKLIIHIEGAAYLTDVLGDMIASGTYSIPYKVHGTYTKKTAQGLVPLSSGGEMATPTMLGLTDGYNKEGISYKDGVITLKSGGAGLGYWAVPRNSMKSSENYELLCDVIFHVKKTSDTDKLSGHITAWCGGGYCKTFYIDGNTFGEEEYVGALRRTFDDITKVELRIVTESCTVGHWYYTNSGCEYNEPDGVLYNLYYREIGTTEWSSIGTLRSQGDFTDSDYHFGMSQGGDMFITYFAKYEKPVNDNIVVLHGGTSYKTKILWHRNEHEITVSDKNTGESVTIMDRNLGAEEPFSCVSVGTNYDNKYEPPVETRGLYYQYGNNYGFTVGSDVKMDNVAVDTSGYGPGNYYSSDIFKERSGWNKSGNKNLWGFETGAEEARQGPCPDGWHIPTREEFTNLIELINRDNIARYSIYDGDSLQWLLLMPCAGVSWGDVYYPGTNNEWCLMLHTVDVVNANVNYIFEGMAYNSSTGKHYPKFSDYYNDSGIPIRPFKNTNK